MDVVEKLYGGTESTEEFERKLMKCLIPSSS
jgi:hypothetical protein